MPCQCTGDVLATVGSQSACEAETFYDELADYYHLLFDSWEKSIARQANILGPLLEHYTNKSNPHILDCACGIGTQALGLAMRGYEVVASDLSYRALERARREAAQRGLHIPFYQADMRDLSVFPEHDFDVVLAADNALPHFTSPQELEVALDQISRKLSPTGILVASVRDYDSLFTTRPSSQPPAFYGQEEEQRILHQVWKWRGAEYEMHLYITLKTETGWESKHFWTNYRALLRADLMERLGAAGFTKIAWLEPQSTSFYQPIVIASKT